MHVHLTVNGMQVHLDAFIRSDRKEVKLVTAEEPPTVVRIQADGMGTLEDPYFTDGNELPIIPGRVMIAVASQVGLEFDNPGFVIHRDEEIQSGIKGRG